MIFTETDRLLLRNVVAKDADIMYDYRNNEICARHQRGQTKDYDGIVALVERRKNDVMSVEAPFMVAVALKDTAKMVGEIVVMPEDGTISLGYTFSYKHHRKGYAFEALSTLISMLHERYPEWDFISFTEPENEPSMALLKKLGFKDMGYIPTKKSWVFGKWTTPATEAEITQATRKDRSAMIELEYLTQQNMDAVRGIHREDISEAWVDHADTIMELTQYGQDHHCIGHTYAVKYGETYIGVILLGEAIPWDTDPKEMEDVPFYRLMGFVIDNRYRNQGIGSYVLELVIETIYEEYGIRPIALGVHKDNHGAAQFYEKHGFRKTNVMEGNDYYYLRYPAGR